MADARHHIPPVVHDLAALLEARQPRENLVVDVVDNRFALRIARLRDRFPRHDHGGHDEAWLILEGAVRFETEFGDAIARSGQLVVIRAGTRHAPVALEENTSVLVMHDAAMPTRFEDPTMDDAAAGYTEQRLDSSA
jgi:mannose-6-phosphate isomerase-like protein (cupin superfamily)